MCALFHPHPTRFDDNGSVLLAEPAGKRGGGRSARRSGAAVAAGTKRHARRTLRVRWHGGLDESSK